MAIKYDSKQKCGEATFETYRDGKKGTYTLDLYVGNCFLIMVDSTIDTLAAFFFNAVHMERCLINNIFDRPNEKMTKIRINKAKCRNYKEIVELLDEWMEDLTIEIYREGEQIWKEWKELELPIPNERFREIAETAISYLNDNEMLDDYLEDRDIVLSDTEKEFFETDSLDEPDEDDFDPDDLDALVNSWD